jgi:hypothetical protein
MPRIRLIIGEAFYSIKSGTIVAAKLKGPTRLDADIMSENKATRLLRLLDELAEAAKRLGVEVRREKILREIGYRARSGACRLREKDLIIIDREMEPSEQIEVFVEALRSRDLEELYLSPEARRLLQGGFE